MLYKIHPAFAIPFIGGFFCAPGNGKQLRVVLKHFLLLRRQKFMLNPSDIRMPGLYIYTGFIAGVYNRGNIWPGMRNGKVIFIISYTGFIVFVFIYTPDGKI